MPGQEIKAKFPLKEARVEVAEVAGKPGVYRAIAFLKPHFQLDELTVSAQVSGLSCRRRPSDRISRILCFEDGA
jgi:predicted component of type VI protein secretion system